MEKDILGKMLDAIGIREESILWLAGVCIQFETLFGIDKEIVMNEFTDLLQDRFKPQKTAEELLDMFGGITDLMKGKSTEDTTE